jgi:hypothetical protein
VDAATGVITTVAGTGTQTYSGDGGPATSAQLNVPFGVAVDVGGNLFIPDQDNHRIRRVAGIAVPPPPTLAITSPTPDQVFPPGIIGTTSVTLTVDIQNHTGHWHWKLGAPVSQPTGQTADGTAVTTGNTATIPGLANGQTHTVYVALVDANHNLLSPSVTASVTFSVDPLHIAHLTVAAGLEVTDLLYGVSPSASINVDPFDGIAPPPVPEALIDARFERPDSTGTTRRYTADFVPPLSAPGVIEWKLRLSNQSASPQSVNLKWQGAALLVGAAGGGVNRATLTNDPATATPALNISLLTDDTTNGANLDIAAGTTHTYIVRLHVSTVVLTVADGWNMLSAPGVGSLAPLASVSMATYRWNATAQAYEGVGASQPLLPFDQTTLPAVRTGFFLRPATGGTFPLSVSLPLDLDVVAVLPASLAPNWSIVGAPASASGIAANVDPDGAGTVTAIDGGFPGTVQWYNPATQRYEVATTLLQGRGYWVLNLLTTARAIDLSQPSPPSAPSGQPFLAIPQPDWMLRMTLELADGSTREVELGSGKDADASFDRYDIPLPPHPDATSPEFYADVAHVARRLSRSVLPVGREGGEWTVTARLPQTEGVVRWRSAAPSTGSGHSMPKGYRLVVESDGSEVDASRAVRLGRGVHTLRVRVLWEPPSRTRLLANFPNPFNPETWIPYELREEAEVRVRIYTASGALVRELWLGRREAGFYTDRASAAYWDGRNSVGESVASGVYFYELEAGSTRQMRRMVIVR